MKYDLIGQRFGKLTVKYLTEDKSHGEKHWMCVCDCGNNHVTTSSNLIHGTSKQCHKCAMKQAGMSNRIHGTEPIELWRVYQNMKTRCINPKYCLYHRYGGRGITICDEWMNSFTSFREWAFKNGYKPELSLDRINNDGNYCPENCKWSTVIEQANNRRNNRMITINGETDTMANWSRRTGIPYWVIQKRLGCGWSENDAVTIPYKRQRR